MGRRSKSGEYKAKSTTVSLNPKHYRMLDIIMQQNNKTKSQIIQELIEKEYNTTCKQEESCLDNYEGIRRVRRNI